MKSGEVALDFRTKASKFGEACVEDFFSTRKLVFAFIVSGTISKINARPKFVFKDF